MTRLIKGINQVYENIEKDHAFAELRRNSTQLVAGEGPCTASVVFVGEAPGQKEDTLGRPFAGPAGEILDRLLAGVGTRRGHVYITNVVKYRPPGNRTPSATEIEVSKVYLLEELSFIRASKIVLLGRTASRAFGYRQNMSILHGTRAGADWSSRELWFSYHPAAALYDKDFYKILEEDFSAIFGIK